MKMDTRKADGVDEKDGPYVLHSIWLEGQQVAEFKLRYYPDWNAHGVFDVEVAPEFRRQGWGQSVADYFAALGCRWLCVLPDNIPALKIYSRAGFQLAPDHHKVMEDGQYWLTMVYADWAHASLWGELTPWEEKKDAS